MGTISRDGRIAEHLFTFFAVLALFLTVLLSYRLITSRNEAG